MITYELHPLATIFPQITGEVFDGLVESIRTEGLRDPITLLDGRILDGRNRASACAKAGVLPRFEEWRPAGDGDTPEKFVIARNLYRRHLNDSQRAMVAARLADHPGGNAPGVAKRDSGKVTKSDAARMLGVPKSHVRMARDVLKHGDPETIAKVDAGQMKVGAAQREAVHGPRGGTPTKDADRTLAIVIRGLIDEISGRPREVQAIPKAQRVALVREFAEALQIVPKSAPEQTLSGNSLA